MSYYRILVVDDEEGIRHQLTRWLSNEGYATEQAANGKDALKFVRGSNFHVVLLDLRLPDRDGLQILETIHKEFPDICLIVLTAFGGNGVAGKALQAGAFDYFDKPFDFTALSHRIDAAVNQFRAQRQNVYQREEEERSFQFENIIGRSPAIREMFAEIKTVAATSESVLILGETGTGKDLLAGALHYNSPRRQHRLFLANCTTLPENLGESELFGHEKGAFTGADKRKTGKFEQAHLSSLFIDEVGELSPLLQTKFLQFLQNRTFERVGSNEPITVDVRIIAATNKDLQREVEAKRFRADLFHRLNRFVIRVPPLRERQGDIPLLVEHFIRSNNRRYGRNIEGIAGEALEFLQSYSFPGNVRELENAISRAMLHEKSTTLQESTIRACLEPAGNAVLPGFRDLDFRAARDQFEIAYFKQLLERTGGNVSQAAEFAGLDRTHLRSKLKRHGLK